MGNKQGAKLRSRDREELRRRTNFSQNEIGKMNINPKPVTIIVSYTAFQT